MGRRAARGHLARLAGGVAMCLLFLASRAEAANEALVRLLQVLRDRGSISTQEYEDIRKVAEAPDAAPAQAPAAVDAARVTAVEQRVAAQEKTVAGLRSAVDGAVPPLVNKTLAGKWYER